MAAFQAYIHYKNYKDHNTYWTNYTIYSDRLKKSHLLYLHTILQTILWAVKFCINYMAIDDDLGQTDDYNRIFIIKCF